MHGSNGPTWADRGLPSRVLPNRRSTGRRRSIASWRTASARLHPTFGICRIEQEPGPYSMPALADAVAAHLDRRGLKQVILVGGSMGGVVAQYLTIRRRGMSRLCSFDGRVRADPAVRSRKRM